jgi:hypothetical protein
MKKTLKSFLIVTLVLVGVLALHQLASATDFRDVLTNIGDNTNLENYDDKIHDSATGEGGAQNITSAIFYVIDFTKYVLGSIAVLMLILNAVKMVTAGKDSEEEITKEKTFLKYALMGLVLVFVSEEAVKLAFFGEEGNVLASEESAAVFGAAGGNVFKGIYTFVEVFMGSFAVLMIVFSALQILIGGGSEEAATAGKKRIFIASIGLVVIGISDLFINGILFKDQGSEIDVEAGRNLIVSISNFLVSTIATIAVLAFVYAGFLYILNFGNEEMTGKAKKIMGGAVIGMVLAAAAFAIVSTVIPMVGAQ